MKACFILLNKEFFTSYPEQSISGTIDGASTTDPGIVGFLFGYFSVYSHYFNQCNTLYMLQPHKYNIIANRKWQKVTWAYEIDTVINLPVTKRAQEVPPDLPLMNYPSKPLSPIRPGLCDWLADILVPL